MPTVVSTIDEILDTRLAARQDGSFPTITFTGVGSFHIDPQTANAAALIDLLSDLKEDGLPVYAEIDDRNLITEIRIPFNKRVIDLQQMGNGDIDVNLEISHAFHVLKRSNPNYNDLKGKLEAARTSGDIVTITEDFDGGIIDVRGEVSPKEGRFRALDIENKSLAAAAPSVSPAKARELFHSALELSCAPTAITPICIPFLYPRDGCWARAHEVYRILSPFAVIGKCWLYGPFSVRTANDPTCSVRWRYHVTPTVLVSDKGKNTLMALDPSLLTHPVSTDEWASKQIMNGRPIPSDGSVYYRSPEGGVMHDHTFVDTAKQLVFYRRDLQLMTAKNGPPPYARCGAIS